MKHILLMFTVMLSALAVADKPVISAERLAQLHTSEQVIDVGNRLGIGIYDGPYDGEMPLFDCTIVNATGCLLYTGYVPGVSTYEILASKATQEVEDYLYYHAYRNVNAGYYSGRLHKAYKKFVDNAGFNTLLQVEVFMLKSGQKPITLFSNTSRHADLISLVKEIY